MWNYAAIFDYSVEVQVYLILAIAFMFAIIWAPIWAFVIQIKLKSLVKDYGYKRVARTRHFKVKRFQQKALMMSAVILPMMSLFVQCFLGPVYWYI